MVITKKTITVTTISADGKSTTKTETTTSTSDAGGVDLDEVEEAMRESTDAMAHFGDLINEAVKAVVAPFDRLFKKQTTEKPTRESR
jgi:hypothetical protein